MTSRVFETMLARYECQNTEDKLNAIREVMQQVTLAALSRGGFFNKAAFYGGTCCHFVALVRLVDLEVFSYIEAIL